MLTFSEHRLSEAFTSPASWRWTYKLAHSVYNAKFSVDDYDYIATFDYSPEYEDSKAFWMFSFGLGKDTLAKKGLSSGVTIIGDTGAQMRVFSTVIAILKAFIAEVRPDRIEYEADPYEPSRVKLYARLTKLVQGAIPGYRGRVWGGLTGQGEYTIEKIKS